MQYFKFTNTVDGEDDPIIIVAKDEEEARDTFAFHIGEIPAPMLLVKVISEEDAFNYDDLIYA